MDVQPVRLRYLDAEHVEHPSGTLGGLQVCTDQNEQLGALEGVLIEPSTRRVMYFVVDPSQRADDRYIVPADTPAVLDLQDRKLRVNVTAGQLERLNEAVPAFSDEDVLTALFRSSAA